MKRAAELDTRNLADVRLELRARRHAVEMLGLLREVTYAPGPELLIRIDRVLHEVLDEGAKE